MADRPPSRTASIAMRPGRIVVLFATAAAAVACAYVGYRVIGWLGVGMLGLVVALVAVQVDMDSAAPIGVQQNTGLFAGTIAAQDAGTRAEKAGRRAEAASRGKVLLVAKVVGAILAAVGGIGFVLFQLPG